MKLNKIIFALILGVSVAACAQNKPAAEAKQYAPSKAEVDSVSYLIGINFGSFLKSYDWGDLNYSEIVKGMKEFVNAKGDFRDPDFTEQFKIDPNKMNDIFNNYLEKRHTMAVETNKAKGAKFLEDNAKKAGVQTTESGLQYKIIEAGNDVKAAATDTVWVNYKGTLTDGTVFDEVADDAAPIMMPLDRVIPGWTEGLQLVGEGGHIELVIPSDLAYGENGNQTIGPNEVLCFDVKVSKVGKVAPVEAE